jgi:hypothetical protein
MFFFQADDIDCGITLDDSGVPVDSDGVPDCGGGPEASAIGICGWRNAVYEIGSPPRYQGCFIDSQGQVGAPYQLGGDTYIDPAGFGLSFDGEDDFAIITDPRLRNYADDGQFSISFFFSKSECKTFSRYQQLYRHRAPYQGSSGPRARIEVALGCSKNGEHSVKADTTTPLVGDIIRTRLVDSEGYLATFDVSVLDEAGGGYLTDEWVHFVLSVNTFGAQVYLDGRQIPKADFGFNPRNRDDDGNGIPDANAAIPDPGMFTPELVSFDGLSAGIEGPRMGGYPSGDRIGRGSNYEGNIAGIVIWQKQLLADDVACLYNELQQFVAVCQKPEDMWGTIFQSSLRSLPQGAFLEGDAYVDKFVGLTFDGQGDSATITGLQNLMSRGDFTVSFWMTKTECTVPGWFERVYTHRSATYERGGPRVYMEIGCPEFYTSSAMTGSEIQGPVIRTRIRDDNGNRAEFDVPMSVELRGGYVTDMWVQIIMGVSPIGIVVFGSQMCSLIIACCNMWSQLFMLTWVDT